VISNPPGRATTGSAPVPSRAWVTPFEDDLGHLKAVAATSRSESLEQRRGRRSHNGPNPTRDPVDRVDGLDAADLTRRHASGSVTCDIPSAAAKVSKMALDAGVDERRQRLAEAQAADMYRVMQVGFKALKLAPEQEATARAAMAAELRRMGASHSSEDQTGVTDVNSIAGS
jgi:hypothetical protein